MKVDELRERYLEFFKKQGHTVHPSDSLVPSNDPSLLFTGAGMNQFKDMFLGRGSLPFKRATTSQKCLRTGDLERVGRTAGHQTFFEMLGNFSFGDYFKREAITWAWEFANQEVNIPAERLFVSVYQDDDEAYDIWNDEIGIPEKKIFRLGEEDNFWPASAPSQGPNGPCGPCSEIYYDFGPKYGCGQSTCDITCSCNRYVEIWNLVFTQFDRQEDGSLPPLPQKNIDTGAGLERFAAVLQGVGTNFEIDIFKAIIAAECSILSLSYVPGTEQSSRLRRIADHIRALVFCIADNALPGNTGRNYVVRRILRTALRDGVQMGHKKTFLHRLVPAVVEVMKKQYPDLADQRKKIEQIVKTEEEKFLDTLEKGTEILAEMMTKLRKENTDTLPGPDAFKLYDTFGFPIEMTEETLRQNKFKLDRAGFDKALESSKTVTTSEIFEKGPFADIKAQKVPTTQFLGYGVPVADIAAPHEAEVLKVITLKSRKEYDGSKKDLNAFTKLLNSGEIAESAPTGAEVAVLLDRTPFYGESGGQIGDVGTLAGPKVGDVVIAIEDCKRPDDYFFHLGKVTKGTLKAGDRIRASVDATRRLNIMRNHTGTHILQAALRAVLGSHVQQAGSVVEPDRLRFDFSHFQAVTADEIRKIEDWVNDVIFSDYSVAKAEMSMEEAKAKGAIAFFGEKYGTRVRVVTVGPSLSVELCGGTHLEHSGTIGGFRITSESSVGSGVRRLEAVTGPKVLDLARADMMELIELGKLLKSPRQDVKKKVQKLMDELNKARSQGGKSVAPVGDLPSKEIGGEKIVAHHLSGTEVNDLRKVMDQLIKKKNFAAAILAGGSPKPAFVIGVREDVVKSKGLKAGDLAKEIGKACGGGGGGRELQAQAGASDASKIPLGLETFESLVRAKLGS